MNREEFEADEIEEGDLISIVGTETPRSGYIRTTAFYFGIYHPVDEDTFRLLIQPNEHWEPASTRHSYSEVLFREQWMTYGDMEGIAQRYIDEEEA